ncbi:MAG: nucleoside hydrolase [Clostridiales bacterium]|nr:nucleoside hydrolase [Clostridiales bacterium]
MGKIKMILDCDTGHDDAIALMLASKHPDLELLGVTTVSGNAPLEHTLPNTLHVCQLLELNVPVYGGMDRPMVRDRFNATNVHGESGLDGPVFGPLLYKPQKEHAVEYIIRTLMESDGDIVLVPTGPLTNIGMALRLQPKIAEKIRRIVMMGGAYGMGNITPAAEFNIYADPEAAHIVFSSGIPIVMMGLDLTEQALATMEIITRMENIGNKAGKLFGDMMRFTFVSQNECFGLEAGPVHDVTAVAYLVAPELFTLKEMNVQVDISHGISYGKTVCDFNNSTDFPKNASVGVTLDVAKFWDLVEEIIRRHI